jgi:hypothetical protein
MRLIFFGCLKQVLCQSKTEKNSITMAALDGVCTQARRKEMEDSDLIDRYEIGLKVLSRNDAFFANVNTKSTILLSLSAAVIAAIGWNYDKYASKMSCPQLSMYFSLVIVVAVIFLLLSVAFSLYSVYPHVVSSSNKNNLSFVDVVSNYKTSESYAKAFSEETQNDMLHEISTLNFHLSKALVSKYKLQRIAISFMGLALFMLFIALIIIIIG